MRTNKTMTISRVMQQEGGTERTQPHTGEVSIYRGRLTAPGIVKGIATLKKAFPDLDSDYFDLLAEMVREEGFTDERFLDAVKHTIKTCIYPRPTIAQVMSYDRKVKTYTYHELLQMAGGRADPFKTFVKVKIRENQTRPIWVRPEDAERYRLTLWEKKTKKICP